MTVAPVRITNLNEETVNPDGRFVLYWMTAARRLSWNFALQRAVDLSVELQRPLLVFEPLSCSYPWASDRLHRFVIQGMVDNAAAAREDNVCYYPWLERSAGDGRGLFHSLAGYAAAVVADDFPCFFLPKVVCAAAANAPCQMEAVDSNGLLPLRATDRLFTTAFSFRNYLQKNVAPWLVDLPDNSPLSHAGMPHADIRSLIPADILKCWPTASVAELGQPRAVLETLPIDHSVSEVSECGGTTAARAQLAHFLKTGIDRYATDRSQPDTDPSSRLSPWLHFGHLSAHEVFSAVVSREDWAPSDLGDPKVTKGRREGWWNLSEGAESFLDELITWREIGLNRCAHDPAYDQFHTLPDFALQTLDRHRADQRPWLYSLEEFRDAATHDEIWNAAQRQLTREGRMHNYLRMLWGKKILEWTETPETALDVMIELNNRYALDGRDPNSYSGIFWVLGRFDRAWGPERPVFGKVRYMSSDSTRRKIKLKEYLAKYSE